MKFFIHTIAIGVLALAALPAMSQQTPPHPGKAPLPGKPPTVTAVNPPRPGTVIVGAQQNGAALRTTTGYGALNTQPIPPGHAVTPVLGSQYSGGKAALNTQPIPPGH